MMHKYCNEVRLLLRALEWLFRTAQFRAPRLSLTFCGERFSTSQTLTLAITLPCTALYGVCHYLIVRHCWILYSEHIARSNATSSNKTLTLFSAKFAFRIL